MMSDKMMFGEAFDPKDNFFARLLSNFRAAWAASTGEGDVPGDAPVHFTMIREEIVFKRLADQLGFAFGELQRDPAGFVAGLYGKVILDEVQRVPEIFTSIKAAVDSRRTPGLVDQTAKSLEWPGRDCRGLAPQSGVAGGWNGAGVGR